MKLLISLLLTIAYWLSSILYMAVVFIPMIIFTYSVPHWNYQIARVWGKLPFTALFIKKSLYGFENIPEHPVIIASNHTSMLDIHMALGDFPKRFHFLAKEELFKIPAFGLILRTLGFYPINRTNPRRAVITMKNIIDNIKQGASILIYPEGTRNRTTEALLPFKNGMAKIAYEAQTPILPMVIKGGNKIIPPHARLFSWHPISMTIGKPINPPQNNSKEEFQRVNEEVRKVMLEILANN